MKLTRQTEERSIELLNKCGNTVAGESHLFGLNRDEPLVFILDGLLRYAKAYQTRFGGLLASDYVLGPSWLQAAIGVRELLNGDGVVAMETERGTDSKDNGFCEAIFWDAMKAAGFTEDGMNSLKVTTEAK